MNCSDRHRMLNRPPMGSNGTVQPAGLSLDSLTGLIRGTLSADAAEDGPFTALVNDGNLPDEPTDDTLAFTRMAYGG